MADQDGSAFLGKFAVMGKQFKFRFSIKCAGRLVKNEDLRIPEKSSNAKADFLWQRQEKGGAD
jgi:hypothetical protein